MKRVAVAAVLLLSILSVSVWSLFDLYSGTDELLFACSELASLSDADNAELQSRAMELETLWQRLESRFTFYIQHEQLDQLSVEISRLPVLAENDERGEYFSSVAGIISAIEDIRLSALPSFRTLL